MVTWTTYGTWLQGDKRGYVKDVKTLGKNNALLQSNLKRLKNPATRFDAEHRTIVRDAILKKAQEIRQQIYAIAICSSLRAGGFDGKIWTKGFDKRFCFNRTELTSRINYVKNHTTV